MLQLTESANLFVSAESDNCYQHTAGLVILDAGESPDFCFEKLKSFIAQRTGQIPQFRWKLKEVPFGLDLPYWVEDERFSIDRHVHRIAVPAPGDMKALTELAAYLYSRRLDRAKPLWEIWLIEGLQDNRFGLLQKMHHCMMDGQGAQKIGEALCDFEPDPPPRGVPAELTAASTGAAPSDAQLYARTLGNLAVAPVRTGRHAWSMLRPGLLSRIGPQRARKGNKETAAPTLPCNGEIGTQRGFACISLPLPEIKQIKNRHSVSINDVVLALTASAMRGYLLARGALPERPARANMAVSLRKDGDAAASNAVTTANISLHTDRPDAVERLLAIHQETDAAKQLVRSGRSSVLELVNSLPPFALSLVYRAMSPEIVLSTMKCNFVVSNVKGSAAPMYLAGARIEAMYPISLLLSGMGLNFTCVSYVDKIDFGITYDPELVPEAWRIVDGLQAALREYLRAGEGSPARARRAKAPAAKARRRQPVRRRVTRQAAAAPRRAR